MERFRARTAATNVARSSSARRAKGSSSAREIAAPKPSLPGTGETAGDGAVAWLAQPTSKSVERHATAPRTVCVTMAYFLGEVGALSPTTRDENDGETARRRSQP